LRRCRFSLNCDRGYSKNNNCFYVYDHTFKREEFLENRTEGTRRERIDTLTWNMFQDATAECHFH